MPPRFKIMSLVGDDLICKMKVVVISLLSSYPHSSLAHRLVLGYYTPDLYTVIPNMEESHEISVGSPSIMW